MAIFSSISSNKFRSTSLPNRTHPTTLRVEEELKKLKSWEKASSTSSSTTATTICSGLLGLQELHKSIDNFLNLPSIRQPLSHLQKEKWVDELLDKSVRFLDICGIAKDIVSQCKDNVRDLQSSLRRNKGSESIEKYFFYSRKMKKDVKRSLASLMQINQGIINPSSPIKLLKDANSRSVLIFQEVLKFLSTQFSKQKTSRWTMVFGLLRKGKIGSEDLQTERFNVYAALIYLYRNDQNKMRETQNVQNRLGKLEGSFEVMENELEAMSRCLIRSRTTLLNVFSS